MYCFLDSPLQDKNWLFSGVATECGFELVFRVEDSDSRRMGCQKDSRPQLWPLNERADLSLFTLTCSRRSLSNWKRYAWCAYTTLQKSIWCLRPNSLNLLQLAKACWKKFSHTWIFLQYLRRKLCWACSSKKAPFQPSKSCGTDSKQIAEVCQGDGKWRAKG